MNSVPTMGIVLDIRLNPTKKGPYQTQRLYSSREQIKVRNKQINVKSFQEKIPDNAFP